MMNMSVYMACHFKQDFKPYDYITPIHVGAANADGNFCEVADNSGENISRRNKIYCELTGLYWIWKNCKNDYKGICHYRRFFNIEEHEILNLMEKGKVIIPKRAYLGRSIEGQYKYNHCNKIWDIAMMVISESNKNDDCQSRVFEGNRLYPFNMLIAPKMFFDEYAAWLFGILFEIEKRVGNIELDDYQIRYAGFLAERLFTYYVLCIKNETDVHECLLMDETRKTISPTSFHKIRNNIYFKTFGG